MSGAKQERDYSKPVNEEQENFANAMFVASRHGINGDPEAGEFRRMEMRRLVAEFVDRLPEPAANKLYLIRFTIHKCGRDERHEWIALGDEGGKCPICLDTTSCDYRGPFVAFVRPADLCERRDWATTAPEPAAPDAGVIESLRRERDEAKAKRDKAIDEVIRLTNERRKMAEDLQEAGISLEGGLVVKLAQLLDERTAALSSLKSAEEEAGRLRDILIEARSAVEDDARTCEEHKMTGLAARRRATLARIDSALKEPRHG